jgi:hypothetical protein
METTMIYATKNNILTFVAAAWQTTFSGAQLDPAISACLSDLNSLDLLQKTTTATEIAELTRQIAMPDDYKGAIAITIADTDIGPDPKGKRFPLVEAAGGMATYRQWQIQTSPNMTTGRPVFFVEDHATHNIVIHPLADKTYKVYLTTGRSTYKRRTAFVIRSGFSTF